MIAGLAGTLLAGFGLLITTVVWVIAAATGSSSRKEP
jgi:hypothetical protein